MFRFTYEPSSGSHDQYLAKITNLVVAHWWWFVREPKHVGAAFISLIVFNSSKNLYIWVH